MKIDYKQPISLREMFDICVDVASRVIFLVKQFTKVGYFRNLLVYSTLAAFLMLIVLYSSVTTINTGLEIAMLWKRCAFIGFWSTCTASAGILGMSHAQGVLEVTITAPRGGILALYTMIVPVTIFASLAFPFSWILSSFWAGYPIPVSSKDFFFILLLMLSALLVTIVTAGIFLISKHASTYEQLILVPVMFFAGAFAPITSSEPNILQQIFIPLSYPLYQFYGQTKGFVTADTTYNLIIVSSTLSFWLFLGLFLNIKLTNHALSTGSLRW